MSLDGQISIFDWMPTAAELPEYPSIDDIQESEAVQIVADALGLNFIFDSKFREWLAKKRKLKLTVSYSRYNLPDNTRRFLNVGYELGTSGGGRPCDTIQEAIDWFKRKMKEYD